MENLDIIILTGIVILCFITFFISTFKTFDTIDKNGTNEFEKRGIISRLLNYFESLV
jgi:hypothetical protein